MTSDARAQRLMDEFHEGATWDGALNIRRGIAWDGAFNIRRGIAWVLRHIADTEGQYTTDDGSAYITARTLEDLADALEAPTLLDRAMAGDAAAARQFLREAGFTDASGNWLPQYQPSQEAP